MTPKEKQRELIIEIMKADEESGLYDEPSGKKTPVELLFDALWTAPKDKFIWNSILIKAKEMEKEQIISFGKKCFYKGFEKSNSDDANCYTAFREEIGNLFEQYYNETYKSA